jgi:hypothetical protein
VNFFYVYLSSHGYFSYEVNQRFHDSAKTPEMFRSAKIA